MYATETVKGFKDLNENQKAERKYLVTAVDIAAKETDSDGNKTYAKDPIWQVVGAGVEDSSIELNPDTESVTDILGVTETTVNKLEISQSLDPMTVRGGSQLALNLHDIYHRKANSEFSQFRVLLIFAYETGDNTHYFAEMHEDCTITPNSFGGSGYVDMPIDISLSNKKTLGYVDNWEYSKTITFTADSSASI